MKLRSGHCVTWVVSYVRIVPTVPLMVPRPMVPDGTCATVLYIEENVCVYA